MTPLKKSNESRAHEPDDRPPDDRPPEDRSEEPGAEGGSQSPAADTPPGLPSHDESPLGDTDQHSTD